MSKKSILIGALSLLWFSSLSLQAQPLLRYTFDDGTPKDITGNADGVLLGNAEIVVDSERGQVLQINQSGMKADGPFEVTTSFTLSAWVKLNVPRTGRYYFGGPWWIRTDNQEGSEHHWCEIRYPEGAFVDKFDTRTDNNPDGQLDGQWHHIVVVLPEDGTVKAYVDGAVAPVRDNNAKAHDFEGAVGPLFFGTQDESGGNAISGYMDDIQVFNYAVSEDEIQALMEGGGTDYPFARGPNPKDGALHVDTWVNLSWSAGDFAVSHDVYLGDDFDVVGNATRDSDVFRGNQVSTFYIAGFPGYAFPEGLVPGTTYYWRIDEVTDADPNSPWKGEVWSFSIPPKTAYNPDPADGAEFVGPDNVILSWTPGFGAILHTVFLGDDYDEVGNATVGIPAGSATYRPGPLELEKVYYWRVDEFDAVVTHKGDIWDFTTPGAAGIPQPANGAVDVEHTPILSWIPADNAISHEIYFGTERGIVKNATTASPEYKGSKALGSESFDPGKLDWHANYYWRVDAVYTMNTVKGLVWSFTTADFLLIDDFESYTDDDPAGEAIWQSWIDGFGVSDNGAQVGYLMPPYAEQTIVHGGAQSMPLLYVNEAGVTNSEASLTLAALRDWTTAGVGELSLWFRGSSTNAADPLYVALSNAAGAPTVVAYEDPAAATIGVWTEWRIALQAFADQGINLTNVNKLAIGLGSKGGAAAGGTGTMFIDDIRLYLP